MPGNVKLLVQMIDASAKPDDYVFKNTLGAPIDQRSFYKLFRAAQRKLGIRQRDLYAIKDTYVSCSLTRGVNLTWLSEQTGVADAKLWKHYGSSFTPMQLTRLNSPKSTRPQGTWSGLPLADNMAVENVWIYKEIGGAEGI
jgi:hypothetical protein